MALGALDPAALGALIAGALAAGFVSGFSGFGTALVTSGLWYYALPAPMVPPLVVMAGVAGQLVGLVTVRRAFAWDRAAPYLGGGLLGVPLGVAALSLATPETLRATVGAFLVAYAAFQLAGPRRLAIGAWGGRRADAAVGLAGGVLGGFAGLSGALPLVWLQLRGGPSAAQRAVYQPFNLVVLTLAGLGMAVSGHIDGAVLTAAAFCLPATVGGAILGARVYHGVSEAAFRRAVLGLLLASGVVLLVQTLGGMA